MARYSELDHINTRIQRRDIYSGRHHIEMERCSHGLMQSPTATLTTTAGTYVAARAARPTTVVCAAVCCV